MRHVHAWVREACACADAHKYMHACGEGHLGEEGVHNLGPGLEFTTRLPSQVKALDRGHGTARGGGAAHASVSN